MYNNLVFAVTNPYVSKINTALTDAKGWGLAIIGSIAIVVIVMKAIKYVQGNGNDKNEAIDEIKKTVYIGAGVYALIWMAQYIFGLMAS